MFRGFRSAPDAPREGGFKMFNRLTLVGMAIAVCLALFVAVMVNPAIGPRASQADLGNTSISIEAIHQRLDHTKLPIHLAPEP